MTNLIKHDYSKLKSAMRYWLLGREWHIALKAMEIGLDHHRGLRKDSVTPEFAHQIEQAHFARSLSAGLLFPEETITTIFLHDVVEDAGGEHNKPISIHHIRNEFPASIAIAVELMTNKHADGTKKPEEQYYSAMAVDAIASVTKPIDRFHNQSTMTGVFTYAKQMSYVNQTEHNILPMIKSARHIHTRQEPVYQNVRLALINQINAVRSVEHQD